MTNFADDLRFASRQLRKSPGFALTAVLTLALGVGATAAVYSVVQTVLLAPLPYADPNNLVGLAFSWPHAKPNAEQTGISAEFVRDHSNAFSSVAIMDDSGPSVNLSANNGRPMQESSLRVSEGYFRTLGASPELGRGFLAEEDRQGGPKSVVLSFNLWSSVFNRDPAIVGRTVRLNEESFSVVGIMPKSFSAATETAPGVQGTPALWQPLQLGPKDPGYDGDNYEMIGRLKPGVTLAQLRQQLNALEQPFYQQYPTYRKWTNEANVAHVFRVWPLQEVIVSDIRRSLLTVMGAVLAVLLVACLNLAGLMTARSMRRLREVALRSALGATRGHLLRLVLCEGLLLAFAGGTLAVIVASVSSRILLNAAPLAIPSLYGAPPPLVMALAVLLTSFAATATFSVVPTWTLLRNSNREMRLGGPSLGETISDARISRSLMVVQIALAMVLVSTASSLLGTFVKLRSTPPGIEPKQLTAFQVTLKGERYSDTLHTAQLVDAVLDQIRQSPGIDSAAAINGLPLDRGLNDQGYPSGRENLARSVEFRPVSPNYFRTMGIPLVMGRDFAESDRADGDPVAVISEAAARKWWPGSSPIGSLVHVGNKRDWRIVGVASDVHAHSLVEEEGIMIYGPIAQVPDALTSAINQWFPTSFVMRTAAHVNVAAVAQHAVSQADPELPVARLASMQEVIEHTFAEPRFFSLLATGFSTFAVGLTVIGLFGLLTYQVTQRTREIGVRMALGADRLAILLSFLTRGLVVASAGVLLGVAASWWMRPVINHLLVDSGVDTAIPNAHVVMSDLQSIVIAAIAILSASIAASWLPARRAASVEPMQALRAE